MKEDDRGQRAGERLKTLVAQAHMRDAADDAILVLKTIARRARKLRESGEQRARTVEATGAGVHE